MSRKKQQGEIRVVNLSSYTSPQITENNNKDFIEYGENNDYFQYLIDLYHSSPTNNAIINGLIEIIFGNGLDVKDKIRKPDEYAMLKSLISDKELRKIISDLKIFGNVAIQVVYSKGKEKINKLYHFPTETIRSGKANNDGEVEQYLYHPDWANKKNNEEAESIPAFGFGSKSQEIELAYIKPYRSGFFYYSPVDYQGCLPYCEIENEIANYHINNIKNGFSPSLMINFNNGVPDDKTKNLIEQKIVDKFSGSSNAGKAIIAFNDDKERAATIEAVQLSDAHNQYQFIADEATKKIMVGHRITSPMLLGIKDSTGLGNNAEELKEASKLLESNVANPFRTLILSFIDEVLAYNKASINVYFKSMNPFGEEEKIEESQLHSHRFDFSDNRPFLDDDLAGILIGNSEGLGEKEDIILEEYEEVDSMFADDESTDDDVENILNNWANEQVENNKSTLSKIKEFLLGDANDKSKQDTDFFKVRYIYASTAKDKPTGSSRPLCSHLMSQALIYRKEDIKKLSSKGGAESKGESYDVFLYKGGANCQHGWLRKIYKKKAKKDGTAWGGGAMNGVSKSQIYQAIKDGVKVSQSEDKKAMIAPRDTKTKGYKK